MAIGALIGALVGFAGSGTLIAWGLATTVFGAIMMGAAVGSLFDGAKMDIGGSTPNYSFGPIGNTKTQLLPVPIVYGKCRVAGNIFQQRFFDDDRMKMDLLVGLGEGPINRVVSVAANEHVLYGEGVDTNAKKLKDCSCSIYLGTGNQPPDKRNVDNLDYPNTAYVALSLKSQEGLSGNPTITSIIEGMKVWTPQGIRYTRNPAWIVYDLLLNERYGVGLKSEFLNLETFKEVAKYCDETVDGGARHTLDYIIDQQRPAIDILRDMLACFKGYVLARDKVELHVDRPVSAPYKFLDENNIVRGTFQYWQAAASEVANRVIIEWIDPDNYYERSSAVFEEQADIIRRGIIEKQMSLLGLTSAQQVARMGTYLLEVGQKIKNFCSFCVGLQDADVEAGDVIGISYASFTGWNKKWFRVLSVEDSGDDLTKLTCSEYEQTTYTAPPMDFPRVKPGDLPPSMDDINNLILSLEGRTEPDGSFIPTIKAEWSLPDSFTPKSIEISYRHTEDEPKFTLYKTAPGDCTEIKINGCRAERMVEVNVCAIRPGDGRTKGETQSIFLRMDTIPPGPCTGLTATGWFGSIWLEWRNPEDDDLAYIEIWECDHEGEEAGVGDPLNPPENAVMVGRIMAESYTRKLGSFQARWYWVRAVDRSGNIGPWNDSEGTPGYSDQASHQDFVDEIIKIPEVSEAINELNAGIDSLSETILKDLLSGYSTSIQALLAQRMAEKTAEAQINGILDGYDQTRNVLAVISEEKNTQESENEAMAEWIRTVAAMIGDPDNPASDTVYAAVREEMRARVKAGEAIAEDITALNASIGDPSNPDEGTIYAALKEEARVRATTDYANAEKITTLATGIGDPTDPQADSVYAALRDEAAVRANADSANANSVKTLQTQVGDTRNSVQILAESVDGVKGKYAVKIDTNGRVVGYELIGTGQSSSMVFHVDNFLVGAPNQSGVYPFVIGTVGGVQKVSMSNAFIQDAAIDTAKIRDLTVERLKIKDGAISQTEAVSSSVTQTITTTYITPSGASLLLTGDDKKSVLLWVHLDGGFKNAGSAPISVNLRILRDSTIIKQVIVPAQTNIDAYWNDADNKQYYTYDANGRIIITLPIVDYPPRGSVRYSFQVSMNKPAPTVVYFCYLYSSTMVATLLAK